MDEARSGLMERFGLSEIQAKAILDMRLQRLTGLERDKVREDARSFRQELPITKLFWLARKCNGALLKTS